MGTITRLLLVAAVTVGGALIAWPFLLHHRWPWILVGAVGAIALFCAAGYLWSASRLGRDPVKYLTNLEWTAAVIPISLGLLAATAIAWLTGRFAPGNSQLHGDLGVGLGGITAALTAGLVDPLKDGGWRATRIRKAFEDAFLTRVQELPKDNTNRNRWELSLAAPAQAANWATAADRKDRAKDFQTVPA